MKTRRGRKAGEATRKGGRGVPAAAGAGPQTLDVAVRERLLAAATALFARRGYAATTVREIVAAAGVTKPVLYYYFRNKEGIYLELMRAPFEEFGAMLDAAGGESVGARDRLTALSVRTYELFVKNLSLARLMYAIYYGPPQGAPFIDFDAYHDRFREAVAKLLEEGIGAGEFRRGRVGDMSWAIIGAANIAMEIELCHPERSLGQEGLVRVLDIIFEGMAARREAPGEEHR